MLGKRIKVSHRLNQKPYQYTIGGRKPKRPNNRVVKVVKTVRIVAGRKINRPSRGKTR